MYWQNEGEHLGDVAASLGMNHSWGYKCRAMARGRGRSLKALRSTKGTGLRKLTSAAILLSPILLTGE